MKFTFEGVEYDGVKNLELYEAGVSYGVYARLTTKGKIHQMRLLFDKAEAAYEYFGELIKAINAAQKTEVKND